MITMKKFTYKLLLLLSCVVLAVGCQSEGARYLEQLTGEWHHQGTEGGVQQDVWIAFSSDMTFEMFQKIGEGAYRTISGRYGIDGKNRTISGIYEDSYPWKYDYRFEIDGDVLVMTAAQLESHSVTYNRESIPAQVRTMSVPLTKAETVQEERYL